MKAPTSDLDGVEGLCESRARGVSGRVRRVGGDVMVINGRLVIGHRRSI